MKKKEMYCLRCGHVGKPKIVTPGSFAVELLLYLLLIIPGFAYSCWRVSRRFTECRQCGEANMIPLDSPKAIEAGAVPTKR